MEEDAGSSRKDVKAAVRRSVAFTATRSRLAPAFAHDLPDAFLSEFRNQKRITRAREVIAKLRDANEAELFSDEPTRFLWLPNLGAGSGVSREELISVFSTAPGFIDVSVVDKQPYAMVEFESSKASADAVKRWHLSPIPTHPNKLLILLYSLINPKPTEPSPAEVSGLHLIENFISEAEEQLFIRVIDSVEGGWQELSMRKVKHWGYAFNYQANQADPVKVGDLPGWSLPIVDRLCALGLLPHRPDQLTVNVYTPGAGIPAHVETHSSFEDGLASLSLLSQYTMLLRHPDGLTVPVPLRPRSLLILTNEARYQWSHAINPRKTDLVDGSLVERGRRISLTFRKVRGRPCECEYRAQCDTWMTCESSAHSRIEDAYVKSVYDAIAPHFSATRYKPWPRIERFLAELPPGSLVSDVGCGNGKYLGVASHVLTFGNDQSVRLVEIARDRGHEVAVMDALQLPLRDAAFDAAISIAVIHHFSTPQHRQQALRELARITRPGGQILVYVWAMEQTQRAFGQQDVLVPWHLKEPFFDAEGANDVPEAPLVSKAEQQFALYQRYYHVFRKGELSALMSQIEELEVHEEYFDHANWAVKATRKPTR